jgi:hypothetical protein
MVPIRCDVFPALFRPQDTTSSGVPVGEQGEAECFNHPGKQAVVACRSCGRLFCALCEIKLEEKSLCIHCLQSGKEKKKISSLDNKRTLYDHLAFRLAFWPMLFILPTLATAPAVLFITFRYWKAPGSILGRSRFRFIVAAVLAVLQIIGWILFFSGIIG